MGKIIQLTSIKHLKCQQSVTHTAELTENQLSESAWTEKLIVLKTQYKMKDLYHSGGLHEGYFLSQHTNLIRETRCGN